MASPESLRPGQAQDTPDRGAKPTVAGGSDKAAPPPPSTSSKSGTASPPASSSSSARSALPSTSSGSPPQLPPSSPSPPQESPSSSPTPPPAAAAAAPAPKIPPARDICFELLRSFALRTGLINPYNPQLPNRIQTRCLRTDALAVCALVSLKETELANRLADQVNWRLGRTADGKHWLSGLSDREGALHPTIGGLRAGLQLPERDAAQADPGKDENHRDGFFLQHMTLYVRALIKLGRVQQARDLAVPISKICRAGMYWKVRISDMAKPLVRSRDMQDAMEALIAFCLVQEFEEARWIAQARCGERNWTTGDMMALGALLTSLSSLRQLGAFADLQTQLRVACLKSLKIWNETGPLESPAGLRLCFRECALALGLSAVANDAGFAQYQSVAERIRRFWSDPETRRSPRYQEDRDLNDVMLCLALMPEGFVQLR